MLVNNFTKDWEYMNIEDLGDQLIEMHGELQKANRHLEKIAAAANII